MIAGLIPLVYGVMKFTLQKYAEGGGLVSMGIVWIALAWWIQDRQDKRALLPLSLLLLFALVYAVRILLLFSNPGWTDFLFPLVLFGLLSYFLLYVRSLLTRMASPGVRSNLLRPRKPGPVAGYSFFDAKQEEQAIREGPD